MSKLCHNFIQRLYMQSFQSIYEQYIQKAKSIYNGLDTQEQELYDVATIAKSLIQKDILVPPKNKFEEPKRTFAVENFKPFSLSQKTAKKPITLVYGPNSIGKSSYLRSLLYLQAIKQEGKTDIESTTLFGDEVDFGGFYSCVHKHDLSQKIAFELTNNFGSYTLALLFGYTEGSLKFYKKYRYDSLIMDENLLKVLLYFSLEIKKAYIQKDIQYRIDTVKSFDLKNEIFEYVTGNESKNLDIQTLFSKFFIKKYAYLIDQEYTIEDIVKLDVTTTVEKFQKELQNIVEEIYPIKLFELLSDKVRVLSAKYTVENKDILTVVYSIDNEKILTLKSDLSSFKNRYALDAISLKFLNRSVSAINFHKHSFFKELFGEDIEKSSFFDKFDLLEELEKMKESYGSTYWQDNYPMLDIQDFAKEQFLKNNIFTIESPIQVIKAVEKHPMEISKDMLFRLHFREYVQYEQNYTSQFNQFFKNIFTTFEKEFKIERVDYFAPLRFYPDRYFSTDSNTKDEASQQNWAKLLEEEVLDSFRTDEGEKTLKEKLDTWLSDEKLKTPYSIESIQLLNDDMLLSQLDDKGSYTKEELMDLINHKITPIKKIVAFRDKNTNTIVSHKDLGLGISQVLPILVSLFSSKKDQMIAIEQPELHLHPRLQSELSDEFIKSAKNGASIVAETHSEHLLLRMMKRMRQTTDGTLEDETLKLTPDDIALLYVDTDGENTYILELELDEDGSLLDPWPGGFFEEGFNERFL